jgi:hypothetical protein
MTSPLAPCPFCASPAALTDGPPWRVTCTSITCRAAGPEARTVDHARRLWATRASPEVSDERAAVIAFLFASIDRKEMHVARQDTSSQRAITHGQLCLLWALVRDIRAGAHLAPTQPPTTTSHEANIAHALAVLADRSNHG